MNDKSKGIRPVINALEVNEGAVFNLDEYNYNSVRATAFSLNVETTKVFTTSIDRTARAITVTRVK